MKGKIEDLSGMGRRRFLSSLAALGVSGTTLNFITTDALADLTGDVSDQVPYVERVRHTDPEAVRSGKKPKREPIYNTISRDRWIQIEAAHDAATRVEELINSKTNAGLISAGVTSITTGHRSKKAVVVNYNTEKVRSHHNGSEHAQTRSPSISFQELKDLVPATVSGKAGNNLDAPESWVVDQIPVVLRKYTRIDGAECKKHYYDSDYGSSIPAGARYEPGGSQIGTSSCTLGTPAYNNNAGERQMVTAAHCINDINKIYQPTNGDFNVDGYAENYKKTSHSDFGIIRSDDNNTGWELYKYRLAEDDGTLKDDMYIEGTLNWSTIKYHEGDSSYTLDRQGARTGTTSGYITETHTNNGEWTFWTNCDAHKGDSGGPFYKTFDNNGTTSVYIAGIYAWFTDNDSSCPGNRSGGNAMEYIEDHYELTV